MVQFGHACRRRLTGIVAGVRRALRACLWARPVVGTHAAGTGGDLLRGQAQHLAENALLRQQLLVLRRSVARPVPTPTDRAVLVLLIVQPETLLRWHRAGFRALWRRKSRPGPGRPPLPAETVGLIRRMATENPLWGAERIRGELGKLGIHLAKRTIPSYLHGRSTPQPGGQDWATFLRNHAGMVGGDGDPPQRGSLLGWSRWGTARGRGWRRGATRRGMTERAQTAALRRPAGSRAP